MADSRRRRPRRATRPATGGVQADRGGSRDQHNSEPDEPSRDDTDQGWGEHPRPESEQTGDRWLREQRPPHWG